MQVKSIVAGAAIAVAVAATPVEAFEHDQIGGINTPQFDILRGIQAISLLPVELAEVRGATTEIFILVPFRIRILNDSARLFGFDLTGLHFCFAVGSPGGPQFGFTHCIVT